ncbi:MAG: hypothetical protein GQ477_04465 [Nanohaloarchaea archaeon]|nr:hypothetical protein [Candidatus Nanohaloarchaea archaeon]
MSDYEDNLLKIIHKSNEPKECLRTLGYDDPKMNIIALKVDDSLFYSIKAYGNHHDNQNITNIPCCNELGDIIGYISTMMRRGFECISKLDETRLTFNIEQLEHKVESHENGSITINISDTNYTYRPLNTKEWFKLNELLTDEHKI